MDRDKVLLIDGDILLYRFAYGDEFTIQWDEGTESSYIDFDQARRRFDECVEASMDKTRCARAILCFSVPTQENFRLKIFPAYKQNRAGLEKPQAGPARSSGSVGRKRTGGSTSRCFPATPSTTTRDALPSAR